jgi:iron complex outermembrane recepter protein
MIFIYLTFLLFIQDTTGLVSPAGKDTVTTEENPVTIADDAFGTSIGGENIGLYQAGNVRGFNPVVAGNARLEGLYFDQMAAFTGRLVRGSTILVGLSALADPFPAPTGIVNARLRKPGNDQFLQAVPQVNSFGGMQFEVAAEVPVMEDKLGLGGGIGFYEHNYHNGGNSSVMSLAFTPRGLSRARLLRRPL